ncbi:hypothetical protein DYB35_007174 [Aphanomyces astaci]|uniref:Condensin complex subunit 2 n=1 Tax=Aphanomyces astaci TaxID=112090 RepID=A0A418DL85_APHAT|nr:hypothetical protein DYB35_007174 [Aphanomyces astaci]
MGSDRKVNLVSSEGESFEVSVDVAKNSRLIHEQVEEDADEGQEIPLPNVKTNVLIKVIEFLNYHHTTPMKDIPKPITTNHDDEPADSAAATDTYNFQKASCTLDASVKIYSYRVDDTWNSSFKVLENLTRGDERTPHAPFSILNLPLNESTVHNGCKIVLDSSNVKAASNTPADGHAAAEDDDGADDKPPRKMINISGLTKRLRASATVVESFDICPKLDHFYDQLKTMNNEYFDKKISVPRLDLAASSHNRRLTLLSQGLITPRKTPLKPPANAEEDANPLENTSTLDIDQPDFGMGGNDGDDEMGQDDNDAAGFETYADDATQQPSGRSQHDDNDKDAIEKTEPEIPVVVAKPLNFDDDNETSYLLESALMRSVNAEQMDEYSFFDAKTLKNWAGPQHWKVKLPGIRVKKSAVVGRAADKQGGDDDDGGGPKKPKSSRTTTPGKLQWSLTPTQVTQALKKPRQAASLEISPSILKRNESKAAQLVHPVDMHMKVERFYQLFTRPRSNVMFASMMAAAPRKALHHSFSVNNQPNLHTDHDDDNGVYERFAKRVDVKKLKESIWGTLPFQDAAIDDLTRATSDLAIQSKVSFEELVQDVAPKVPPNVTVSFYFICMLHLANDKGLELVGQDDMRDFQILHDPSVPR